MQTILAKTSSKGPIVIDMDANARLTVSIDGQIVSTGDSAIKYPKVQVVQAAGNSIEIAGYIRDAKVGLTVAEWATVKHATDTMLAMIRTQGKRAAREINRLQPDDLEAEMERADSAL